MTYISNGTQTPYTIPFEYLSKSHVHIYLNDTETKDYTYITAHTITFDPPIPSNTKITIKRKTPYDQTHITWQDGSVLIADDLNAQELQNLYITQENLNRISIIEQRITDTLDTAEQIEESLQRYSQGTAVPFGRFYVGADGNLKLAIYGDYRNDNIYINGDGNLILESSDIT